MKTLGALVAPLACLLPALLSAQARVPSARPEPSPPFGERLEVGLVEIEVRVADRDGRPVPHLGAADFELLVGGQRVEPTHFAEVSHLSGGATATTTRDAESPRWLGLFLDLPTFEPATASRLLPWIELLLAESGARIALGTYRGPGSFHMQEITSAEPRIQFEQATSGLAASSSRALQRLLSEIGRAWAT